MLNLKYVLFLTTISLGVFSDVAGQTTGNTYNSSLLFYNGATPANFVSYNFSTAEDLADNPTFDRTKLIAIFVHGWMQKPADSLIQTLIQSYIVNGNYNLLVLDWKEAASSTNIASVRAKVPGLGDALGSFLNKIFAKGVDIAKVHLIGHSYGAYVASRAGLYIQQIRSVKLPRISGLDPGNFYTPLLKKTDAIFVDAIHTNPGLFGTFSYSGAVDFFPNMYWIWQPGCPILAFTSTTLACSHNRAIDLWSESVRNNNNLNFLSTNVYNRSAPKIQMGNNCPTNATGVYKLYTNSRSLFSKS